MSFSRRESIAHVQALNVAIRQGDGQASKSKAQETCLKNLNK